MSLKSFFSSVESEFKKLFGSAPAVLQTVSGTLTVVAPLISTILVLTGEEPEAAAVAVVVSQVQSDIAAVSALIKSSGSTPTVTSVLTAVIANLKDLLTAGDIKNPETLTKVTAAVNVIVSEFEAVLAVVK